MKTKAQIMSELKECLLQSKRLESKTESAIDQDNSVEYKKLDDRSTRLTHRIGALCWVLEIDPDKIPMACHCGRDAKWVGNDNELYCGFHAMQFTANGKKRIDSES